MVTDTNHTCSALSRTCLYRSQSSLLTSGGKLSTTVWFRSSSVTRHSLHYWQDTNYILNNISFRITPKLTS